MKHHDDKKSRTKDVTSSAFQCNADTAPAALVADAAAGSDVEVFWTLWPEWFWAFFSAVPSGIPLVLGLLGKGKTYCQNPPPGMAVEVQDDAEGLEAFKRYEVEKLVQRRERKTGRAP